MICKTSTHLISFAEKNPAFVVRARIQFFHRRRRLDGRDCRSSFGEEEDACCDVFQLSGAVISLRCLNTRVGFFAAGSCPRRRPPVPSKGTKIVVAFAARVRVSLLEGGRLRGLVVACWTTDHYHPRSNLGVGISEGCFVFDFASSPSEVARPI